MRSLIYGLLQMENHEGHMENQEGDLPTEDLITSFGTTSFRGYFYNLCTINFRDVLIHDFEETDGLHVERLAWVLNLAQLITS